MRGEGGGGRAGKGQGKGTGARGAAEGKEERGSALHESRWHEREDNRGTCGWGRRKAEWRRSRQGGGRERTEGEASEAGRKRPGKEGRKQEEGEREGDRRGGAEGRGGGGSGEGESGREREGPGGGTAEMGPCQDALRRRWGQALRPISQMDQGAHARIAGRSGERRDNQVQRTFSRQGRGRARGIQGGTEGAFAVLGPLRHAFGLSGLFAPCAGGALLQDGGRDNNAPPRRLRGALS